MRSGEVLGELVSNIYTAKQNEEEEKSEVISNKIEEVNESEYGSEAD